MNRPYHPWSGDPPQPGPRARLTLLSCIAGSALALVLVTVAALALTRRPSHAAPPAAHQISRDASPDVGVADLHDVKPDRLLPLMPTDSDFPPGAHTNTGVNQPGEGDGDAPSGARPGDFTDPAGCWDFLRIARNRSDQPGVIGLVTSRGLNDKNVLVAGAQIAKESRKDNYDAIARAKSWMGECPEFDIHTDRATNHFQVEPFVGPAGFPDPVVGYQVTESHDGTPLSRGYYLAARVRGLLIVTQALCAFKSCDGGTDQMLQGEVPIMFSKIAQGLRNLP